MNNTTIDKKDRTANLKRIKKTGGRRKRPNTRRVKKEAEELKFKIEFNTILSKINNCIREAYLEGNKHDLINYLKQSLVLIYSELRPQELHRKSKDIRNIKYMRKNWFDIREYIIRESKIMDEETDVNKSIYVFRESFKFYNKNLSEYGMKYMAICYKRLYDSLLNKVYTITPTDEQKPTPEELKKNLERLGLDGIGMIEFESVVCKDDLHMKFLEKTLEYHMDTPNAIKEKEKYQILRKRIRKALVALELHLDYFTEKKE
jgi:hypothetical protein